MINKYNDYTLEGLLNVIEGNNDSNFLEKISSTIYNNYNNYSIKDKFLFVTLCECDNPLIEDLINYIIKDNMSLFIEYLIRDKDIYSFTNETIDILNYDDNPSKIKIYINSFNYLLNNTTFADYKKIVYLVKDNYKLLNIVKNSKGFMLFINDIDNLIDIICIPNMSNLFLDEIIRDNKVILSSYLNTEDNIFNLIDKINYNINSTSLNRLIVNKIYINYFLSHKSYQEKRDIINRLFNGKNVLFETFVITFFKLEKEDCKYIIYNSYNTLDKLKYIKYYINIKKFLASFGLSMKDLFSNFDSLYGEINLESIYMTIYNNSDSLKDIIRFYLDNIDNSYSQVSLDIIFNGIINNFDLLYNVYFAINKIKSKIDDNTKKKIMFIFRYSSIYYDEILDSSDFDIDTYIKFINDKVEAKCNNIDSLFDVSCEYFAYLYSDMKTIFINKFNEFLGNLSIYDKIKLIQDKIFKDEVKSFYLNILKEDIINLIKEAKENIDSFSFSILVRYYYEIDDFDMLIEKDKIIELKNNIKNSIIKKINENKYNKEDIFTLIEIVSKMENNEILLEKIISRFFNIDSDKANKIAILSRYYPKDKIMFIKYFDKVIAFLRCNNILEDKFFQYSLICDTDWLNNIVNIINLNKEEEFKNIFAFFVTNVYSDSENSAPLVNHFNLLLNNYSRYFSLLNCIVNNNIKMDDNLISKLTFLFNSPDTFEVADINSLDKIDIFVKDKLNNLKNTVNSLDISSIKDNICMIMFNMHLLNVESKLSIYGNVLSFEKLKFDNRRNNNSLLNDNINYIEVLVSMMEDICLCKDKTILISILNNIITYFDSFKKIPIIFSTFDKKMRKIFEMEANINLSNNCSNYLLESGIKIFDYRDKEYVLLAHVMSPKENISYLVNGISNKDANFISLSSISHRNQVYYGIKSSMEDKIIFGYDYIPLGNYIYSSLSNMGSNFVIREGSSIVREVLRKQRGILETSMARNMDNSEVLCYRENLKPRYIILPGGRKPTNRELELAREYNLSFVKTQELGSKIEFNSKDNNLPSNNLEEDISYLEEFREKFFDKNKKRRIAIITDLHGLFEPTLAILEDIRRRRIDEIYSLGDNIGTGPNPDEVISLLNKYHVKSVYGNHELYLLEGIFKYKKHFEEKAYPEEELSARWTKDKIKPSNISKLKLYPGFYDIALGGKKILLTHYIYSYLDKDKINESLSKLGINGNNSIIKLKEMYDKIYEGHIHFGSIKDNIEVLPSPFVAKDGTATYTVLTEEEHGFSSEKIKVSFDIDSLLYSINESDMDEDNKCKIESWVEKRGR